MDLPLRITITSSAMAVIGIPAPHTRRWLREAGKMKWLITAQFLALDITKSHSGS
jgi:hypothetical protein